MPTTPRGDDLDADYVDEDHINAFAVALAAEDDNSDVEGSGLQSPMTSPMSPRTRVRKISALSDFAPIAQKVRRRRRTRRVSPQKDLLFHIVRWPLLFLLLMVIFAEFGLYVFIRQVVRGLEWVLAWRGRKGLLRSKLRTAKSHAEWKTAALTLDQYLGFDEWKKEDESPFFDYLLVKKVRRSLRSMREKNDVRGVLGVLEVCVRGNFAGTESARLYSESFWGTKNLIESYIKEVEEALDYIRKSDQLSLEEKRRFFRTTNRNLGASALCLSGGASFGYYHFGVVKALLDSNLLPRVIAGTSCGSLIAAFVCTRTDEELKTLLNPSLAKRITACEEPFRSWFRRFLQTGARFDTVDWARKAVFWTRGSLTFREAYELTGRVLNVSVIPFDRHSPTKLLNHLTAPDCVIWSAIIASAAVPGILNPVVLMQKAKTGEIIPWNWGSRFKDGSLRVDVPLQSLNLLFNVNHPIVSQVNPHVHIFFFSSRGSAGKPVAHHRGKGWRGGFLLSAAEQWLKHELTKNFRVIRDLELMPQLLGQDWSSVFLQRFEGTVTIIPRSSYRDWLRILSDPDEVELERMIGVGEQVTWPKLHMIENRIRIERKILRGRQAVRRATMAKANKPTQDTNVDNPPPLSGRGTLGTDRVDSTYFGEMSSSAGMASRKGKDAATGGVAPKLPFPAFEQLAVESDAEAGFKAGDERFFKKLSRHSRAASHALAAIMGTGEKGLPSVVVWPEGGPSTQVGQPPPSPTSVRKRRWAANSGTGGGEHSGSSRTRGEIPEAFVPKSSADSMHQSTKGQATPPAQGPHSPSLFQRLRSASLSSFVSPFGSRREKEGNRASVAGSYAGDERWSEDSSSDEELIWNAGQELGRESLLLSMDAVEPEPEDRDLEVGAANVRLNDDLREDNTRAEVVQRAGRQ